MIKKITFITFLLAETLWGLSVIEVKSKTFSSPENTYLIRYQNDREKDKQRIYVYKFNLEKKEYESISNFKYPYLIREIYVNDLGTHIIHIYDYEQFISIFDIHGKELKVLNFHDFYTIKERQEHGYDMSTIRHIDNIQWKQNSFIINPAYSIKSAELKLEKLIIDLTSFNTRRESIDYSDIKEESNSKTLLLLFAFTFINLSLLFITIKKSRKST